MNEISKEQLLYMKRTRQHKQFVLFFQLFLFIFFIIKFYIFINMRIRIHCAMMIKSHRERRLKAMNLKICTAAAWNI